MVLHITKERNFTGKLHLNVYDEHVYVCRDCFVKMLDETQMILTNALSGKQASVSYAAPWYQGLATWWGPCTGIQKYLNP
jgi:hypothetical protein